MLDRPASAQSIRRWMFVFFLLVMAWGILIMQGLPLSEPDDLDKILVSHDTGWMPLIQNFFSPVSLSSLWSGQTDRLNEMIHMRVGHTLILKAIQSVFGFQEFPFYFFTKIIFFAGTSALVFLLMVQVTAGSLVFAVLGTLAYVLVPAHYSHVLWIAEAQTLDDFFIIVSVLAFMNLLRAFPSNSKKFTLSLILFFAAAWTAIKIKETALILPVACLFYLLFRLRFLWKNKVRSAILLFSLAWLLLLKIPVFAIGQGGNGGFSFHWNPDTIVRLLFRNYDCGYDHERVSAFFSIEHLWPVSMARTLGMPFLWTSLGFIFIYGIRRFISKKPFSRPFLSEPLAGFSVCWFLGTLPFLSLFQPDPRYFSTLMIPFLLIMTRLFDSVLETFKHRLVPALGLALLPLFSLGFFVYENSQHVMYLRSLIGKRLAYFEQVSEPVYSDLTQPKPLNREPFMRFSAAMNYAPQTGIAKHLYFAVLGIQSLNHKGQEPEPVPEGLAAAAPKGYRYAAVFDSSWEKQNPSIRLIAISNGINSKSFYEALFFRFKKKKRPMPIYIYRWDRTLQTPAVQSRLTLQG